MKKLIKDLETFTMNDIDALTSCIQDRLDFEYDREPESDGMVYDAWSERTSDLEDIIGLLEECESETDFKEAIEAISDFQLIHGGLSRLNVY